MATNLEGTRPADRPNDPTVVDPVPTPMVIPTGSGVAVYDGVVDKKVNPAQYPSTSLPQDPAPVETRATSSILAWIIGAIVIIVLAYFLLQMFF